MKDPGDISEFVSLPGKANDTEAALMAFVTGAEATGAEVTGAEVTLITISLVGSVMVSATGTGTTAFSTGDDSGHNDFQSDDTLVVATSSRNGTGPMLGR